MAEGSQQKTGHVHPPILSIHQPGPEDISDTQFQQSVASQLSKEKLYQQRQKCELKRLLKHTHPELKELNDAVDEELAEVLSSETGLTTGETGYEGEVLSKRLIFENCAWSNKSPYTPKKHEATVERSNNSTTSAVFGEQGERLWSETAKENIDEKMLDSTSVLNTECEEDRINIDVQATRRIFESQSTNTSMLNSDKFHGKCVFLGREMEAVPKSKSESKKENQETRNESSACNKSLDLPHKQQQQSVCVVSQSIEHELSGVQDVHTGETLFEVETTSPPGPEMSGEKITTSAVLLRNNPFISTNIERENHLLHSPKSHSAAGDSMRDQDGPIRNVKNRANLFESVAFDKIKHRNQDEVEMMVENIKETLKSLYNFKAIQSGGTIIEVNETMIAKKAKFTLSEDGPEIKYDEVTEGGAQNCVLQSLPRTHLKPHITYLKENIKGNIEAMTVNVHVHQHQFTTNQDTEFKTANLVQVVEDILHQDNSLRKGVIIQEDLNKCAEVIVYSLYNYFDEEDVKSYCPPHMTESDQPEPDRGTASKTNNQLVSEGADKLTLNSPLDISEDQTSKGPIRPEITVKGNVKLFKSCIERGDLEYLKSFQVEPIIQEQEVHLNQNVVGQGKEPLHEQRSDQTDESEWVPVNVEKLKSLFSGDHRPTQPKQHECQNLAKATTISRTVTVKNKPIGENQSSTKCNSEVPSHGHLKTNFRTCGPGTQKDFCKSTVASQQSNIHLDTLEDDDRVHKAELVNIVDEMDEISKLKTAIDILQQATTEAKLLYHSLQEKQKLPDKESSVDLVVSGSVKSSRTEAELPQENQDSCKKPEWNESQSTTDVPSGHKLDPEQENKEKCHKTTNSEEIQTTETSTKIGQKGCSLLHSPQTTAEQQDNEEVVFHGKLQAALNSLERSNINVTRGDFRAAMIYRNSSKPYKEPSQNLDVSVQEPTKEEIYPFTEFGSTHGEFRQEVFETTTDPPSHTKTLVKKAASVEKGTRPVGTKPAIPPKPEHLKVKQRESQSTNKTIPEVPKNSRPGEKIKCNANTGPGLINLQTNEISDEATSMSQEIAAKHQVQDSTVNLEKDNKDNKDNMNIQHREINLTADEKIHQDVSVKDCMDENNDHHLDSHEECKKIGGKKNVPVKPKRVKIAKHDNKSPKYMSGGNNSPTHTQPVEATNKCVTESSCRNPNTCDSADSKDVNEKTTKQESKVEMRVKRGRNETEDERRQRLSVHMDEIMKGNITAAMEIIDNLRKQEELQGILSRVEEIEKDTSEVDVRSLRGVFENVPDWVVSGNKKEKQKVKGKKEREEESVSVMRDHSERKSSMAHVFGDLERASEEIMFLKEQTLARLIDIEGAIKKALYSVSTLKSDSDIVGLSCLFKESLGTVQGSPSSANISKISIGSSRTKSAPTEESPAVHETTALPGGTANNEVASAKQRVSPPSSPAFISIQSAARQTEKTEAPPPGTNVCPTCQHSPKTEEKFQTTKTLTCNSPDQNRQRDPGKEGQNQSFYNQLHPKRELSILEVQTNQDGKSIRGTKTVKENYERTDNFGNRFYSSKTSTVIAAQPETSTGQTVVSPATYLVNNYPEGQQLNNMKP